MAMRLPHPIYNPPVSCQDLPELDLSLWLDYQGGQAVEVQEQQNAPNDDDQGGN